MDDKTRRLCIRQAREWHEGHFALIEKQLATLGGVIEEMIANIPNYNERDRLLAIARPFGEAGRVWDELLARHQRERDAHNAAHPDADWTASPSGTDEDELPTEAQAPATPSAT